MLIIHFVGLALGLGTSFANLFLGIASAGMEANDARKFRLGTLALGRMGYIGLALLIISGIYLIIPYWQVLPSIPLLIAKLVLVIVLVVVVAMINSAGARAKAGDADAQFKKIKPLGKIALVVALLIVVLAVSVFH